MYRRSPESIKLPRLTLSVRWRLTLWYVAILTLVVTIFGAIVYETQAAEVRSQLNEELRRDSDAIASSYNPATGQFDYGPAPAQIVPVKPRATTIKTQVPTPVATADTQKLAALKKAGKVDPSTVLLPGNNLGANVGSGVRAIPSKPLVTLGVGGVVLLVDAEGVVSRYGPINDADVNRLTSQEITTGAPRSGTFTFTSNLAISDGTKTKTVPYRLYSVPELVKNVVLGTLIVGVPDRAPAQLHRLLLTLLIAAPITILVAAAGGYWLATRAMRPVRVMSSTVRSIGATDMSRRLHLPNRDELGDLAATFDQMLDRLEAAFQRQRQFTSDASHELRTPLTIVQLELEHARADRSLSPEIFQALTTIQSENEYMSRLVNDLLTLARADTGRPVLFPERLDLSDIVLSAVERLTPLAHERGITMTVEDLPELQVIGDATYLTQMIGNVIENAIRYTTDHGKSVTVDTGCRSASTGMQAWVRVTDDGPGIAADHLPHLFERFYRADQARERQVADNPQVNDMGGSGLGLSIVQWIARAHGGDVRVDSEVGKGTTAEIWLPLYVSGSVPGH